MDGKNDEIDQVFGQKYTDISKAIKDVEINNKIYFQNVVKDFENQYSEFNEKMKQYFKKKAKKYSEIFSIGNQNNSKKKNKSITQKLEQEVDSIYQIIDLQKKIMESIKDTINLYKRSLNVKNVNGNLDIENFYRNFLRNEFNNIQNCGPYAKLSMDKFITDQSNIKKGVNENILSCIKMSSNQSFSYTIGPSNIYSGKRNGIIDEEIIFLNKNYQDLEKIKINNIDIVQDFFQNIQEFPKLKRIEYNNVFTKKKINLRIQKKFPNLEKLIINAFYSFTTQNIQYIPMNLTHLVLSNNNFVNSDFENIMKYIRNENKKEDNKLLESLKLLSLSNNNISNADFYHFFPTLDYVFKQLNILDLHKNKITEFSPPCCSNKLSINLSYNKLSTIKESNENFMIFMCGNLVLIDEKNSEKYFKILFKSLSNQNFNITNLTLSFLPTSIANKLSNIKITAQILIKIKKIDLSNNNMTCDTFFKFVENNKGCVFLNRLNLSGNRINEAFFDKFAKFNTIFTKLKKINLSSNLIGSVNPFNLENIPKNEINNKGNSTNLNRLIAIYNFIKMNKSLRQLNITKNPLCEKLSINSNDIDIDQIEKSLKKDVNGNIEITNFYSLLIKIKREILKEEGRDNFIIKFDLGKDVNLNSFTFNYEKAYIMESY